MASVVMVLLLGGIVFAAVSPAKAETSSNSSVSTNSSNTTLTNTNESTFIPKYPDSCGGHSSGDQGHAVANSSARSPFTVTIGEPSWLDACQTVTSGSESWGVWFVAYEVFPITIVAGPNVTFELKTGSASPSPQQLAEGIHSNTIWTGFDPLDVTTNSQGIARSNLTLSGAVMPFVPNGIANVSLPIEARSSSGLEVNADLPIEFTGDQVGDGSMLLTILHILQSPGPILFEGTMQGSMGNPIMYAYGLVYSPLTSDAERSPINVSLKVVGSWNGSSVDPLPSSVQVSIAQPRFELGPDQVFYFWVDESNTLAPTNAPSSNTYTFAVQETVGDQSYVEPLSVSLVSGGPHLAPAKPGASLVVRTAGLAWGLSLGEAAGLIVMISTSVVLVSLITFRRKNAPSRPP